MTGDHGEPVLEELDFAQCRELLATGKIGRLVCNAERYPVVVVVNYALDGDTIVIRTHPGALLSNAEHANVCFEVDEVDHHTRTGWSVLVRGLAEEVSTHHDADLIARTLASDPQPWAPGDRGRWLRVIPHQVAGRRIVPGVLPPPFSDIGYL